jgi:MGT family glycosyltransferase
MANVCVLGHPASGHINPTLPLVAELVRRGAKATYYATEPFRARIERTGASFRSYGDHELFERSLASGGMLGGMAGLIQTTEEILPALAEELRAERPDYLLVEAHAVWANLLVQILDVPAVTLCSMFAINESLISAAALVQHLYGGASREQVLEGLVGLGRYWETARRLQQATGACAPGIIDYLGNRQALNIVFTSRDFQAGGELFGEAYAFVGPGVPDSSEPLDEALRSRPGRPFIYVSMGTMYNDEAGLYRACFRAFGDAGRDVVMAVGHRVDRSTLIDVPANVTVREYVPQFAVLQQADLFITHGGINSAHEAMLCGVPMIVLPHAADHYIVASRVAAVGAGVVLDRAEATVERLVELADRVLADPSYRERSAAVGASLRAAGGPARAADAIERLTTA